MRPLLMVHGISSNARKTYGVPGRFLGPHPRGMYSYLTKQGYQPGIDLFWYSYHTLNPIPVSARRLQKEIQNVIRRTAGGKVDLLTFSLGGIIGKYFVVSPLYRDEIHKMVMIAPPFLGSHWADWFRTPFTHSAKDLVFKGDGKALSPQVLSYENPFLKELANTPFPKGIETTIIAVKAVSSQPNSLLYEPFRILTNWAGDGDLIVPVKSSQINVDSYHEITEELSLKALHRYLPYNPRVQAAALQGLQ